MTLEEAAAILQEPVTNFTAGRRSSRARKEPEYFVPPAQLPLDRSDKAIGAPGPRVPALVPAKRSRSASPDAATALPSNAPARGRASTGTTPLAPSKGNGTILVGTSTTPKGSKPRARPPKKLKQAPAVGHDGQPAKTKAEPSVKKSGATPASGKSRGATRQGRAKILRLLRPAGHHSDPNQDIQADRLAGPKQPDIVSIGMGNTLSFPAPGHALLAVAKEAQESGFIGRDYCLTAVRQIAGRFMVPQKCSSWVSLPPWRGFAHDHSCIESDSFCDRACPCQQCTSHGRVCDSSDASHIMVGAAAHLPAPFVPGTEAGFHEDLKLRSASQPEAHKLNPPVPYELKPMPVGAPEVWAEVSSLCCYCLSAEKHRQGRQALCETLPYYRSYQSSAYVKNGLAYALLVDRDCGSRDYMDGEVVITRMWVHAETQDTL